MSRINNGESVNLRESFAAFVDAARAAQRTLVPEDVLCDEINNALRDLPSVVKTSSVLSHISKMSQCCDALIAHSAALDSQIQKIIKTEVKPSTVVDHYAKAQRIRALSSAAAENVTMLRDARKIIEVAINVYPIRISVDDITRSEARDLAVQIPVEWEMEV